MARSQATSAGWVVYYQNSNFIPYTTIEVPAFFHVPGQTEYSRWGFINIRTNGNPVEIQGYGSGSADYVKIDTCYMSK